MATSDRNMSLSATFGRNLRTARESAGYTQSELARTLGTGDMRVSDWERGKHRPNDEYLERLSRVLDRPVHWFFAEHNGEPVA